MAFRRGWKATKVDRATRCLWLDGWDREARCPPSVDRGADNAAAPGGREWREVGSFGGASWRESHAARVAVYATLREAGYIARKRWRKVVKVNADNVRPTRDNARYVDGPAAGCEAVDPWRVASAIRGCCGSWYAQLRVTTTLNARVIGLPRACGQGHVCPYCAASISKARAGALRTVIAEEVASGTLSGSVALVTLTHRAIPGESLQAARARWKGAWRRMTGGRNGAGFRDHFPATFYGIEATFNRRARSWHVHGHVIVDSANGHREGSATLGAWWRWATERESAGNGWDPRAGGCHVDATGSVLSWHGEWWRPIDHDDPAAIYQAAKYPTPLVTLDAPQVAEFVAVAWRKRWHDGTGRWRGVLSLADMIQAGAPSASETGDPAYDVGENVTDGSPGGAPALDQVCTSIGRAPRAGDNDNAATLSWLIAPRANVSAVAVAVRAIGGDILSGEFNPADPDARRFWATLPRHRARALLYEWHEAAQPAAPDG